MTVVLRVPEPLSSSSLGPHSVAVEGLVLQDFYSVKKDKRKKATLWEEDTYDYNHSKCSNKINTWEKLKKKIKNYPWNTAPAKWPPPVMRMTHTVFLFIAFKDDVASSSMSDFGLTETEK